MIDVNEQYQGRFPNLVQVAQNLETFLADLMRDTPGIDRISCRAKLPASFAVKAQKVSENGEAKYESPLDQIQDQIGARVVVRYLGDIQSTAATLERYLTPWEKQTLEPMNPNEFAYVGRHWVFSLPIDVISEGLDRTSLPDCFELQLKSLFQHAWSEAEHDIGYKSGQVLSADDRRLLAFAAAQAWGADRAFQEIRSRIANVDGLPLGDLINE